MAKTMKHAFRVALRWRLGPNRPLKNATQCSSASFETRSCGALLRMRFFISVIYLTLRRPEGPSRRGGNDAIYRRI